MNQWGHFIQSSTIWIRSLQKKRLWMSYMNKRNNVSDFFFSEELELVSLHRLVFRHFETHTWNFNQLEPIFWKIALALKKKTLTWETVVWVACLNIPHIKIKILKTYVIKKISPYFKSFVMPARHAANQHERCNRIMSLSIHITTSLKE